MEGVQRERRGGRGDGVNDGDGRQITSDSSGKSAVTHKHSSAQRERGGRRVAVKAKQNKSESASISSVDIGLIGSLR